MRANKSSAGLAGDECPNPACRSRVHYDLENGKFECAECSTVYRAPKKSGYTQEQLRALAADSSEHYHFSVVQMGAA